MNRGTQRRARWLDWRRADRVLLRRILVVGVVGFALGFGVVGAWMWLSATGREVVTVPDLRSRAVPAAAGLLERVGLELVVGDSLPNPAVPAGAVLTQSPLPGREVGPGSTVRVILSTGPQRLAVPRVDALSSEQASRVLQATGFTVVVDSVPDTRAAGRVVGTRPEPGAMLPIPSPVRLLVSRGPPRVAVPELTGMLESEAAAALDAAGLRLGEVRPVFQLTVREGEVLGQEPAAGDSLRAGSAVNVVVASRQLPGSPVEIQ